MKWIGLKSVERKRERHRVFMRPRRKGIIMVLALWMIVVLSLVAYSLAYEMQMEIRLSSNRRDGLRAVELAKVGVARAIADLKNDAVMDHVPDLKMMGAIAPYDGPMDAWNNPEDYEEIEIDDEAVCTVRVTDEESKIALNSFNPRHVSTLKNLLRVLGVNDRESEELSEAIYDWMDPDDLPVGGEGESEIIFYNEKYARMEGENWDEETALVRPLYDKFLTLEQLLTVPGMTKEIYYGYDPDDPDEVEKYQRRLDDGDDVPLGLRDYLTVDSLGHLNVNTASVEALTAVLATAGGGDNIKDAERDAEKIQKAIGANRRSRANDRSLRSDADIAELIGDSMLAEAKKVQPLSVRSVTFLIQAEGRLLDKRGQTRITRRVQTMVTRNYSSFTVNEDLEDGRERRYNREKFLQRARSKRPNPLERVGAIEIPVVNCKWWVEN